MTDNGVTCSMSRSGNVWDNAGMESFFSSLKTERIDRKTYRTRNHAKAEVYGYIEPDPPSPDPRLSQPDGLRKAAGCSFTKCPQNWVQLRSYRSKFYLRQPCSVNPPAPENYG